MIPTLAPVLDPALNPALDPALLRDPAQALAALGLAAAVLLTSCRPGSDRLHAVAGGGRAGLVDRPGRGAATAAVDGIGASRSTDGRGVTGSANGLDAADPPDELDAADPTNGLGAPGMTCRPGAGRAADGAERAGSAGRARGFAEVGTAGRLRQAVLGGLTAGLLVWVGTASLPSVVVAAAAGCALPVALRRIGRPRAHSDDAVELAAAWAELAVCLEAGLPVAAAVAAAARPLDGRTGVALRRVAGLLELGADPTEAWRAAIAEPATAGFARAAARSAATGAALARTARAECSRLRDSLTHTAEARAHRAGVLIALPLGLCFLPAFMVLGVAPVVIGLAAEVLARW